MKYHILSRIWLVIWYDTLFYHWLYHMFNKMWDMINDRIYYCEPRISAHAFPSHGELTFYLKNDLFIRKWLGVATYFCFIFLKGKQNKKEKP